MFCNPLQNIWVFLSFGNSLLKANYFIIVLTSSNSKAKSKSNQKVKILVSAHLTLSVSLSHTFIVLSNELEINIPVSNGYHCTVSTLNLCANLLDLETHMTELRPASTVTTVC